jgi:hypothetical protein
MLVTISVARLLHFPVSLAEILELIPPVLILSLESPGIPGGAAFFMSPIIAVLLHARDVDAFVATFVTMYSGLIPMFSTAGNTTNNGLVGALLNDRFSNYLRLGEFASSRIPDAAMLLPNRGRHPGLPRLIGGLVMVPGAWMLISPQALLGLDQLKWIHKYAFPGEVVLGALAMTFSLFLLAPAGSVDQTGQKMPENLRRPEPSSTTAKLT